MLLLGGSKLLEDFASLGVLLGFGESLVKRDAFLLFEEVCFITLDVGVCCRHPGILRRSLNSARAFC
jgi:hypothetical protein